MKRIWIFGVALFLLCLLCNPATAGSGWWDEDYGQRIDLTIPASSISGDLQQFPVMIHLGDASGTGEQDTRAVFTEIGADYTKLAIVTEDGENLPVEVTEWNATAQEAWLYTPVNLSSSSDTTISLYYDSGASANAQVGVTGSTAAQAVWSNGYAGVWHMHNSSGLVLDSTANGNNGTIYGATEIGGPLGKCLSFDGTDDYILGPNINFDPYDDDYTVLVMATPTNLSGSRMLMSIAATTSNPVYTLSYESVGGIPTLRQFFRDDLGANPVVSFGVAGLVEQLTVIDISKNGAALTIYQEGVATGSTTVPTATFSGNVHWALGALHRTTPSFFFNGTISEVRRSSVARSESWVTATNAALTDSLIVYSAVGTPVTAADFSADTTAITSGETVAFTATTTSADAWSWDFGDGETSTTQNPTHTYTEGGTYTVTLTASNDYDYITVTKTDYITVVGAAFSADPTIANPGDTITFTDASGGPIVSWLWDFGDGSNSTEQNPTHAYSTAGLYTVNLTVTTAGDISDSEVKTNYIDIGLAPVAGWTANATETEGFPATIAFTDTSTNTPTSWSWDFGDDATSTAQNPTHTYTTDGTYQVTLTATNAYGTDTYSGYIAIGHAGYRPKATGTIAPIDTSSWQSLYEAFGGEEVVAADETGEPDWLTITTVSLAPFLSTWGLLFWVIFYAVPFIVPWIRQEAVIIPSILGLIIGPVMLVKLPGEYHAAAIIFLALSIAGIVLVAVTTKRSGY